MVQQVGRAIGTAALVVGDSVVVAGRDDYQFGPCVASVLMNGIFTTGCNIGWVGTKNR